jgi:hypothetical protein
MSKKAILLTLALVSAAPSFASQGSLRCLPAHASTDPKQGSVALTTSATKALRQAEPAQQTADDYAPSARSVYFGH